MFYDGQRMTSHRMPIHLFTALPRSQAAEERLAERERRNWHPAVAQAAAKLRQLFRTESMEV